MNFAVIGAGAWGTAFAVHLARAGQGVRLVPRRTEQAAAMQTLRENRDYLPGIALLEDVRVTGDWAEIGTDTDALMLACPAQAVRETCRRLRSSAPASVEGRPVISLAKGLELHTHRRLSAVMSEELPGCAAGVLAGPTNAAEVAEGRPSAMVLAAARPGGWLREVQAAASGPTLRVYTSDDPAGVEYGGCLKNIYAVAAGCGDGLKLGDNAKAALLTRALREMVRVGAALGAQPETFYGLSGFGDLVATCHGAWSRNRAFGQRIGEGAAVADLLAHRKTVVEGYKTTEAFAELCRQRNIDAPILREVEAILYAGKPPAAALQALMSRDLKRETAAPAV